MSNVSQSLLSRMHRPHRRCRVWYDRCDKVLLSPWLKFVRSQKILSSFVCCWREQDCFLWARIRCRGDHVVKAKHSNIMRYSTNFRDLWFGQMPWREKTPGRKTTWLYGHLDNAWHTLEIATKATSSWPARNHFAFVHSTTQSLKLIVQPIRIANQWWSIVVVNLLYFNTLKCLWFLSFGR